MPRGEAVRQRFADQTDLLWAEQAQQLGTGHADEAAQVDFIAEAAASVGDRRIVVFLHKPGVWIERDEPVVHIIDPVSGHTEVVRSSVSGVMYMRSAIRFAAAGVELCKVAGAEVLVGGVTVSA